MHKLQLKSWNVSEILAEYEFEQMPSFPSKTTFQVKGLHYTPQRWIYDLENNLTIAEINNYCDEYYNQQTFEREIKLENGMTLSQYNVPELYRKSWVAALSSGTDSTPASAQPV